MGGMGGFEEEGGRRRREKEKIIVKLLSSFNSDSLSHRPKIKHQTSNIKLPENHPPDLLSHLPIPVPVPGFLLFAASPVSGDVFCNGGHAIRG